MLIVELVALWIAISVAIGLTLGSRIRRADLAEFPMRQEAPWWITTTPTSEITDLPSRLLAERPALRDASLELDLELALRGPLADVPALR